MRFDTVGVERLWRREDNKATASLKFRPLTCMTRSMLLKFLLQRKQRARLVFGFVAVLNSEHIGQRKRKVPSKVQTNNLWCHNLALPLLRQSWQFLSAVWLSKDETNHQRSFTAMITKELES